jgi:hypothetical protein
MWRWISALWIGILVYLLTGCSSSNQLSGQDVINKFNRAGLDVQDVHPEVSEPGSPLPNSYKERLAFSIPEVAPEGGQVFICDKKRDCNALYAYFDALKAQAGPYLYQSPNGKIVV